MSIHQMPELLAPAGSIDSVYAAVNNGCNAIYLGGKQFSARQYANNFSLEEIEQVCDYCHLRNVKVFLTVNTLYKDTELKEFIHFVHQLYQIGVDALIVQDLGAAKLIQENFPDFELHASTQLTSNTIEDVNFLSENGFKKVVLSRELSLKEITEIIQNTPIQVETFIHGALCVCYSGQCLMSSLLGGRSGNRGRCAQTCRLPYELYQNNKQQIQGHLLSPKDIQTVTILPQLIDAGISSFKIEGRMKNPEYVAGVTSIYRKYIDLYLTSPEKYEVEEKDIKILLQLFNRGGFSQGYYQTHSGSEMMSIVRPKTWGLKTGIVDSYNSKIKRATIRTREPLVPGDGIEIWTKTEPHVGSNISRASKAGEVIYIPIEGPIEKNDVVYKTHDKALEDMLKKTWEKDNRKKEIFAVLKARVGQESSLKLWDMQGNSVFVTGAEVQKALKQPLPPEKLQQQIQKTGATPFEIVDLELDLDDNIYIGISELNDLRRKATTALENSIIKKSKRKEKEITFPISIEQAPIIKRKALTVLVNTIEQFHEAVSFYGIDTIYFEINPDFEIYFDKCIRDCKREKISLYAALPRIDRMMNQKFYQSFIEQLKGSEIDGFLVRSVGQFDSMKKTGKKIVVDYNLNVFNQSCVQYWQQKQAYRITMSPEMNLSEIATSANQNCEMLGYGYLPVMVTHQCPIGNFVGEKKDHIFCSEKGHTDSFYLKDRKGMYFPLMTDCQTCVCYILNSKPLFTLKFFDEIIASPTGSIRLMFTKETAKETKNILKAFTDMQKDWKNPSVDAQLVIHSMSEKGSTKGHYFRGVE